jgi:hypothetical protein
MNHKKMLVIGALATVNFFGSASAMAGDDLPPLQHQGSVAYLTGGVGKDQVVAIKKAASRYPLSLEFVQHAKPKGEFLADVDVTIKDHAGKDVLKTVSDGPFLLVKVPPGKYTIVAQANGKAKTVHATITSRKPEHLVLVW